MKRTYIKRNVEYWQQKIPKTDVEDCRGNVSSYEKTVKSEEGNDGEQMSGPILKRKVGRPRKEEKKGDSCNGSPQTKDLISQKHNAQDEKGEIPILKRKVGRPRKEEKRDNSCIGSPQTKDLISQKHNAQDEKGEIAILKRKAGRPRKEKRGDDGLPQDRDLKFEEFNAQGQKLISPTLKKKVGRPRRIECVTSIQSQVDQSHTLKNPVFVRSLRRKAQLVKSKVASQINASQGTCKIATRGYSLKRENIFDKFKSSLFFDSKKRLAKKYENKRRKSLRSAHPTFKDSGIRKLRYEFSQKKEETVIQSKKHFLQSLKKKQEAALAKIKELEEKIPISHLTPVVELDTDDVLSSAWLPLSERQPLSMEKRMMLRGCDLSHKCCQQRAVEMYDNCTQWEDPTYLYQMLSAETSTSDQPKSSSPTSNTDTASACGQVILNQTQGPETSQVSEGFTFLQQAPEYQLLLQQNLANIESSGNTGVQSTNPENSLSHQVKNILLHYAQGSSDLEHKSPKQVANDRRAPTMRRRKRKGKRRWTKPHNQSQDNDHLKVGHFPPDNVSCDWYGNANEFSSDLHNSVDLETSHSRSHQLDPELSSPYQSTGIHTASSPQQPFISQEVNKGSILNLFFSPVQPGPQQLYALQLPQNTQQSSFSILPQETLHEHSFSKNVTPNQINSTQALTASHIEKISPSFSQSINITPIVPQTNNLNIFSLTDKQNRAKTQTSLHFVSPPKNYILPQENIATVGLSHKSFQMKEETLLLNKKISQLSQNSPILTKANPSRSLKTKKSFKTLSFAGLENNNKQSSESLVKDKALSNSANFVSSSFGLCTSSKTLEKQRATCTNEVEKSTQAINLTPATKPALFTSKHCVAVPLSSQSNNDTTPAVSPAVSSSEFCKAIPISLQITGCKNLSQDASTSNEFGGTIPVFSQSNTGISEVSQNSVQKLSAQVACTTTNDGLTETAPHPVLCTVSYTKIAPLQVANTITNFDFAESTSPQVICPTTNAGFTESVSPLVASTTSNAGFQESVSPLVASTATNAGFQESVSPLVTCTTTTAGFQETVSSQVTHTTTSAGFQESVSPQVTHTTTSAGFQESVSPQVTRTITNAGFQESVSPQVTCTTTSAGFQESVPPQVTHTTTSAGFQESVSPQVTWTTTNAGFTEIDSSQVTWTTTNAGFTESFSPLVAPTTTNAGFTNSVSPQVTWTTTNSGFIESALNYPTENTGPRPLISIVLLDSDSETETDNVKNKIGDK